MKFLRKLNLKDGFTPLEKAADGGLKPLSAQTVSPVRKVFSNGITGFTLIELVMTIVVVAIIAIPLSLLVFEHIEGTFYSEDLTMAINLARFEMEVVNNLAYTDIDNATAPNYQEYPFEIRRTVIYGQGNSTSPESLKRITIEVRKTGSANALVSLVTYIARNAAYGI